MKFTVLLHLLDEISISNLTGSLGCTYTHCIIKSFHSSILQLLLYYYYYNDLMHIKSSNMSCHYYDHILLSTTAAYSS